MSLMFRYLARRVAVAGAWLAMAALAAWLGSTSPAAAQQNLPVQQVNPNLNLPGGGDPTRIELPEEQEVPSFGFSIELLIPDSRRQIPEEEAQSIQFTLEGITVEGVTVYPPEEIEALYRNLIGQEISLLDLFKVAELIETKYRSDDYVLSRAFVPPQRVSDGFFRISAIEGFVNRIALEGDSTDVNSLIESYLNKITEMRPVTNAVIERYVLLANSIPGVSASVSLRPSATEKGAASLTVKVRIESFDGFTASKNRGSRYVGPWSGATGGGVNSFTELGERASFLVFMTKDWDEQRLGSLAWSQKIGDDGVTGAFRVTYATSEPGGLLNDPNGNEIRSKGLVMKGDLTYPLILTRKETLQLEGGAIWREIKTKDEASDGVFSQFLSYDRTRSIYAGFSYQRQDPWQGINIFRFATHQGLDILGARSRDKGEEDNKRRSTELGAADFTRFEAELVRLQRISEDWRVLFQAKGQTSLDRLLAPERIGFGGAKYGRGFHSNEIAGDEGVGASVELTWHKDTDFHGLKNYQFYGFYDYAVTWKKEREDPNRFRLFTNVIASYGFGMRTRFEFPAGDELLRFGLDLEYAKPLIGERSADNPDIAAPETRNGNAHRWWLSITSQF